LKSRSAKLARGVTVMIEAEDWLTKAWQESRRLVIAAGLSDDDTHRLIKRAQFVSAALKENSLRGVSHLQCRPAAKLQLSTRMRQLGWRRPMAEMGH
jgi:hypothetical protein